MRCHECAAAATPLESLISCHPAHATPSSQTMANYADSTRTPRTLTEREQRAPADASVTPSMQCARQTGEILRVSTLLPGGSMGRALRWRIANCGHLRRRVAMSCGAAASGDSAAGGVSCASCRPDLVEDQAAEAGRLDPLNEALADVGRARAMRQAEKVDAFDL